LNVHVPRAGDTGRMPRNIPEPGTYLSAKRPRIGPAKGRFSGGRERHLGSLGY
jgi:hypothetical protein